MLGDILAPLLNEHINRRMKNDSTPLTHSLREGSEQYRKAKNIEDYFEQKCEYERISMNKIRNERASAFKYAYSIIEGLAELIIIDTMVRKRYLGEVNERIKELE